MADISHNERYLNLATLLIGEALVELGNIRQRGAQTGSDTAIVRTRLLEAAAALDTKNLS